MQQLEPDWLGGELDRWRCNSDPLCGGRSEHRRTTTADFVEVVPLIVEVAAGGGCPGVMQRG